MVKIVLEVSKLEGRIEAAKLHRTFLSSRAYVLLIRNRSVLSSLIDCMLRPGVIDENIHATCRCCRARRIFSEVPDGRCHGMYIYETGHGSYTAWYWLGEFHRDGDMPAYATPDFREWYRNGKLHRKYGPARITADGGAEWWWNGRLCAKTQEKWFRVGRLVRGAVDDGDGKQFFPQPFLDYMDSHPEEEI